MNQSPVEKAPLTHKMLLTFHLPRGQRQRIKIIGFRYLLRMQKKIRLKLFSYQKPFQRHTFSQL